MQPLKQGFHRSAIIMRTYSARLFKLLSCGALACLALVPLHLKAQFTYTGTVRDSITRAALPFVNVVVPNTTKGTTTNEKGYFELNVAKEPQKLQFSFLGYRAKTVNLFERPAQGMRILLTEKNTTLQEVQVTAKKGKYKRKDNPAVDFIKEMLKQKEKNQMQQYDYYQYEKYEKVRLDITNMSEKFINRPIFNSIDFVFDNLDTNAKGESHLPFYMEESLTKVYYQKENASLKEYREALKVTNLDNKTSAAAIVKFTENLYEDINIYANQIFLFDEPFMSPLADVAPTFYQFFIQDTITFKGQETMRIAFAPANKYSMAFRGMLHVALDGSYQVLEAHLTLMEKVNLNFVENLQITQEFTKVNDNWAPARDQLSVDFKIAKDFLGLSGYKTTLYNNHTFNQPPDRPIHELPNKKNDAPDQSIKTPEYWKKARPTPLTQKERRVYTMIDTLNKIPQVRQAVTVAKLFASGYFTKGPIAVGDVFTFFSFNQVEGIRLKVAAKTNEKFNERIQLKSHLAYGTKDNKWKYSAEAKINLNEGYSEFPKQFLSFKASRDNQFPGQFIQTTERDNFLLSFSTGATDKMLGYESYSTTYFHELPSHFSYQITYDRRNQIAEGDFTFDNALTTDQNTLETIRTGEIGVSLTYAPNADFYEGQHIRYPIPNKYPILTLDYRGSYDGFLGSEFQFHKLSFGIEKRFYVSNFGVTDVDFRAGKVLGNQLPFVLLHLPPSSQSLVTQENAFNTMRFLEFVSDQYALLIFNHDFNGFFINRIPLLRDLKLREAVSFRTYYGSLSAKNNPEVQPALAQFPRNENGELETTFITDEPYMEVSAGIYNIFKILRVDFVKRLNYLDRPDVPTFLGIKGGGLRIDLTVKF